MQEPKRTTFTRARAADYFFGAGALQKQTDQPSNNLVAVALRGLIAAENNYTGRVIADG
jgi:hypothetical protein